MRRTLQSRPGQSEESSQAAWKRTDHGLHGVIYKEGPASDSLLQRCAKHLTSAPVSMVMVQMHALLGRHVLRAELARLKALKLPSQLLPASWARQDDLPAMLLHWAAFVGGHWQLGCEDISAGVADGRLLCLMVSALWAADQGDGPG